ncbi:MAG: MerR family transcriptional regulator [Deltaproteobacteria bacterium]|nr:MerR family transcriptional regulator [Deltaproteobacteria bacterium]
MTYTISAIARKFGLSRSTLLYYDKIGLLSPRERTGADYRIYSDEDYRLMEEIARLRSAGIPLRAIKKLRAGGASRRTEILHRRLADINDEISRLRQQQSFILNLLNDKKMAGSTRVLTKEQWIKYLSKAGLDEAGMNRWHEEFEASSPEAHQDFLESLGLPAGEIRLIRQRYQKPIRTKRTSSAAG